MYYLGSFVTHTINYVVSAIGSFLFVLATWFYTLTPPTCCYHQSNTTDAQTYQDICKEIESSIFMEVTNIQVPPKLSMSLALIGLIASSV